MPIGLHPRPSPPPSIPAHTSLTVQNSTTKMAVLQVNAFFKKAAPAPKKVAPKKTVVRKAAPVRKASGKPTQAGGDASKWYGTYL